MWGTLTTQLLAILSSIVRTNIDSCTISLSGYETDQIQPLLLQGNALNNEITFLYSDNNDGTITIPKGHAIYLACPGDDNGFKIAILGNKIFGSEKEITAVCIKDTKFEVNKKVGHIIGIVCRKHGSQVTNSEKYKLSCPKKRRTYGSDIEPLNIGFEIKKRFIRTIELCFDTRYNQTLVTYIKMPKMIETVRNKFIPPKFKSNYHNEINMENAYNFNAQLSVMSEILGDTVARRLLREEDKKQFDRGHLVAATDFVYIEQRKSTYWYENTAPQWHPFNAGNWKDLEKSVRLFATENRLDLDVYTGTHGILTIADETGHQKEIFLRDPKAPDFKIYVPKYFWKIIYDPLTKRGTAFVGVNDPDITNLEEVILCNDIRIRWLRWRSNDIERGLSYACSIDDLRESIWLPELDVVGVLM